MATIMQVLETLPVDAQTNVLRDADMLVTFDKLLAPNTVNAATVKLYKIPGYSGVPVNLLINPANNRQLIINPSGDLESDTLYQLMLLGDYNVNDSMNTGIQSTDSSVLDRNKTVNFRTGTQRSVDIVPTPIIDTSTTSELGTYGPVSSFVNVMSTDPDDEDKLATMPAALTVRFDQTVTAGIDAISVTTERLDRPLGEPADTWTVGIPIIQNEYVSWPVSGELFYNVLYTVKVSAGKITSGTDVTKHLPEDYYWSFTGPFSPYFTTPGKVRMRGGFLVKGLSDQLIDRYILQASIDIVDMFPALASLTGEPPNVVQRLATCMVVKAIAEGITLGSMMGVKEKELADLRVVYDTYRIDRPLDDLQDCIDSALSELGLDRGPMTGVKSLEASARIYPNARRTVFTPSIGSEQ